MFLAEKYGEKSAKNKYSADAEKSERILKHLISKYYLILTSLSLSLSLCVCVCVCVYLGSEKWRLRLLYVGAFHHEA